MHLRGHSQFASKFLDGFFADFAIKAIASRRAREASRATETELLAGAEYELTAGAAVRTGALVAVDAAGRAFAEGCEAPAGRPALPVVDIALRRARTSSRVLLYAIVNPIASWLFQSLNIVPARRRA